MTLRRPPGHDPAMTAEGSPAPWVEGPRGVAGEADRRGAPFVP